MTKIIFDLKRDNGYGKMIYGTGSLQWSANQINVDGNTFIPTFLVPIDNGPVEFDVKPTDDTFFWVVLEGRNTSGGTPVFYERKVKVPDSVDVINFLDLEDVDPITITQ